MLFSKDEIIAQLRKELAEKEKPKGRKRKAAADKPGEDKPSKIAK